MHSPARGTRDDNSNRWSCTQRECIAHIERGSTFHVERRGGKVSLVVAESRFGNKYVKTEADGEEPNKAMQALPAQVPKEALVERQEVANRQAKTANKIAIAALIVAATAVVCAVVSLFSGIA